MYKIGLYQLYKQDFSCKTPKELCQIINSLTQKQKIEFWKYLEQKIEPKKTYHNEYFNKQYLRNMYTDILTMQDVQFIKQFKQQNSHLLLIEQKQQLMEGYFLNRDIFGQDVYQQLKQINRHNNKIQQYTEKYVFQAKQKQERTNQCTALYQYALKIIVNTEYDSPKQICEAINSLDKNQLSQFWQQVYNNVQPQKEIRYLKSYYRDTYLQALYDEKLTDKDKKHIQEFCNNNKQLATVKETTIQLINIYFKNRKVFYFDVYFQVRNSIRNINKQNLKNIELKQTYNQKRGEQNKIEKTLIYIQALNTIKQQDYSGKTPKEICFAIQQLNKSEESQLWQLVSENTNEKPAGQKHYYQHRYFKVMFSYQLTSEDKKYIQTYTMENSSITTTELTQQLLDSFFVGQDVFFYDVYNVISQKKKLINAEHTNYFINESRKIQSSYTEIYKLGLNYVFEKEFLTETPQELCNIICQLNQNQRNKFWYYLADNISPKTDIRKLRSYFVSTYQQNQFTDILSNEDIISIKNEYIQNFNNFSKLNSIEITKLIINKLFQQRSLFFNDVHKQIALAQKDAKHKSQ
ncbi:Hypothetical_protein [Hexamita inflata]|uniref:Hypothetical_protein n=1 Tax=Hexamita inflata TaxID=28002 RepID=A0AA86T8Z6_9EUKA|nr:Hypothetical protein HINF_LOCUS254 [Hexamita inflata]